MVSDHAFSDARWLTNDAAIPDMVLECPAYRNRRYRRTHFRSIGIVLPFMSCAHSTYVYHDVTPTLCTAPIVLRWYNADSTDLRFSPSVVSMSLALMPLAWDDNNCITRAGTPTTTSSGTGLDSTYTTRLRPRF